MKRILLMACLLFAACGGGLPGGACTVTIGGQGYPGTLLSDGETCALLCQGGPCFGGQK